MRPIHKNPLEQANQRWEEDREFQGLGERLVWGLDLLWSIAVHSYPRDVEAILSDRCATYHPITFHRGCLMLDELGLHV